MGMRKCKYILGSLNIDQVDQLNMHLDNHENYENKQGFIENIAKSMSLLFNDDASIV